MMLVWSVVAFVTSSAVSMVLSEHPFQSFLRSTYTPLILAAILLGATQVRLRLPATCFVLALAADSAWQAWFGVDILGYPAQASRVMGFLPHPNDMASVGVALPFVVWWAWPVGIGAVLASGSRNALLGVLAGAAVLLPRRWWRFVPLGVVLLVVALMLLPPHAAPLTSVQARIGHWAVAMQMFTEAPIFGKGPHTFVDYYLPYITRMGPLPFGAQPEISFIPWAHSLYFEQLAERGLVGLLVFLVPLGLAWRWGSRTTRAGVTAFLVMGIFDLSLIKPWVVGAYWLLVGSASWQTA